MRPVVHHHRTSLRVVVRTTTLPPVRSVVLDPNEAGLLAELTGHYIMAMGMSPMIPPAPVPGNEVMVQIYAMRNRLLAVAQPGSEETAG